MNGVDPQLLQSVREGTYVVDPHAVAGAMLQRHRDRREAGRLARMLESVERDDLARGCPEDDSGPLPHVS
jgi:hypothetical protein